MPDPRNVTVHNPYVVLFWLSILLLLPTATNCSNREFILSRPKRMPFIYFPQHTLLQTTVAASCPVGLPQRQVSTNFGIQVNFDLPYTPESFWKPTYWDTRTFRGRDLSREPSQEQMMDKYTNSTNRMKRDVTAGEFYQFIHQVLFLNGYEDQCLEKAICEMSQHPIDRDHDNLLTEIFHFVLSPSSHTELFEEDTERHHKDRYEKAEYYGHRQMDCGKVYERCRRSPLEDMSYLSHPKNEDVT